VNFFKYLLAVFLCVSSMIFADVFQVNKTIINKLRENRVRLVVLFCFESKNNQLNIVTSSLSPGYSLTPCGLTELSDVASTLALLNISHIYTSPCFRAQQSASLLGIEWGLHPAQLTVDFKLRMQSFGDAEEESYPLYQRRFASTEHMLKGNPPNGESGLSVFNRTQDALWSVANLHHNTTILLVTHAFNYCHVAKCLTGQFVPVPTTGKFAVYDFNR